MADSLERKIVNSRLLAGLFLIAAIFLWQKNGKMDPL
jgi:hypothetical protein